MCTAVYVFSLGKRVSYISGVYCLQFLCRFGVQNSLSADFVLKGMIINCFPLLKGKMFERAPPHFLIRDVVDQIALGEGMCHCT